jgi:Fe-Mn family superoxide dismutase
MNRRRFLSTAAAAGAVAGVAVSAPSLLVADAAAADIVVHPQLPYAQNALEPYISAKTFSFHYGKHHAGYVKKANTFLKNSPMASMSEEDIIKKTWDDPINVNIFNNVAQSWNHDFYWKCMKPGGGEPTGALADALKAQFGSIQGFKDTFIAVSKSQFASGWGWLAKKGDKLIVLSTSNADNPMTLGMTPLLVVDVWEHAYYLDYQNKRAEYLKNFTEKLINWDFVAANLAAAS